MNLFNNCRDLNKKLIDSDINLFVLLVSIYHFNRNGIVNK